MKQFFPSVNVAVFICPSLFISNNTSKTLLFLYKLNFLSHFILVKFTSCRLPQANLLQNFISYSIRKRQVQKPQLRWIFFHLYWMMITFGIQMKKLAMIMV